MRFFSIVANAIQKMILGFICSLTLHQAAEFISFMFTDCLNANTSNVIDVFDIVTTQIVASRK